MAKTVSPVQAGAHSSTLVRSRHQLQQNLECSAGQAAIGSPEQKQFQQATAQVNTAAQSLDAAYRCFRNN